jgi:hypothetical protein
LPSLLIMTNNNCPMLRQHAMETLGAVKIKLLISTQDGGERWESLHLQRNAPLLLIVLEAGRTPEPVCMLRWRGLDSKSSPPPLKSVPTDYYTKPWPQLGPLAARGHRGRIISPVLHRASTGHFNCSLSLWNTFQISRYISFASSVTAMTTSTRKFPLCVTPAPWSMIRFGLYLG